jgi:hypothetical protein
VSRIRIGTRGSALALWQAEHVKARLGALGHEVELRVITTTGDRLLDRRLESVGGKGAFLKEIEDAMLAGDVDLHRQRTPPRAAGASGGGPVSRRAPRPGAAPRGRTTRGPRAS